MKTKQEIVDNWLPRYTGCSLDSFGKYVLLTNFSQYLDLFCTTYKTKVINKRVPMPCATADGITIINFGMGSANAATIMDLLSAILPKLYCFWANAGDLNEKTNWATSSFPSLQLKAKALPMSTFPRKYPVYRPLSFREPFPPPSEAREGITGQVPFTPPTAECGNLMRISRNTFVERAPWQLIWRLQPSSL